MFRKWKFRFLMMIVVLLVACGKTLDESATSGVESAREVFHSNDKNRTEEINGIELYKPAGFTTNDNSDAQNIVFTKNKKETFILFINQNEKSDSKLFYDLLLADHNKEIIKQATFTDDETFGFAAVVKNGEDNVELIVSVGGSKMTTMTNKNKVEKNLTEMMEIARSIK